MRSLMTTTFIRGEEFAEVDSLGYIISFCSSPAKIFILEEDTETLEVLQERLRGESPQWIKALYEAIQEGKESF